MAARNDVAFSFLRDSTPDNKRLVFMNGSTPGVQAICIKAIAEHETDGNIAQAELLFNNIVKYGLAGLDNDYTSNRGEERHNRQEEDPITRAMRAADSLDRLTADLQPDTDLDFTLKTRPRSMSLPMYSFDDRFGDAAPFYVFGRGVKKTYLSSLIAQLEKLGAKTGDISRSGRLDFRYLVANAMQAFTAQPLANQTHDNPFTNPYLLATLIIPHLEPYFVIHNEVRFLLLEYPPDHLATVLALQKLVGVDLMKVAAIVDSNAKEALPFNHIRGASITQVKEGSRSGSVSPQGKSPHSKSSSTALSEGVAVSKANFLLTSTATEAEITDFVSTIRKLLIEVSRFYVPEEPLRPRVGKRIPTPISGSFSPFPKTSMGLQSPPLSPPPMTLPPTPMRYHPRRPPSPAMSSKAPSLTETVKTIRSTRSRRSKSRKSGGTFGPAADRLADAVSLLTVNFEDDSDYDQEERRLMPIFMPKPHTRKGNNRKALKFLGLA
ncbi:hypothetical protein ACHAQH_007649 [Verticillium albo-atrum]